VTARRDDTVIVGGGVIGCALAAELAARGQRVTVVERGVPGDEASGAAAGMLSPQAEAHEASLLFDLGLESRGLYAGWVEDLRAETGIDVGYRRMGLLRCVFGGSDEEGLFSSYLWQTELGLPVEDRPRASLSAELSGRLSPEVRRAVFFPQEAAVEPRSLVRAVWLSAQRRGVRVLTGTTVQRFRVEGGVCRGVETDAGPLEAEAVVDAAGAWAAFDQGATFPIPVYPVRGQIVQLRVEDAPLQTQVCSDEAYLVPRPDGELLVGSTVELVGFRKAVTAEAVERLLAAAVRLVPALRSARFVSAWSGLRPGTPDGLPLLGDSPLPGLFFATGHYRNGILLAPLTARLVADVLTGPAARDLSAFSVSRFSRSACAV
jgi:glycine oxidase